ncbi:hypothetical protein F0U44_03360 [Nocardioides humilatus]|uniref:Uncharacterized protein n=1 Tax=Nocardioides humilatus TaxID=2607660 RepID=A0A5B1LKS5_9ACTN|nr:hypothetical protein [Nocardioides humilatus]KAA1421355.1 hypothetical protein F0U44_03360 [Nocardioides humilatus]
MALHDELAELRMTVGPQVFDDPVSFRAAFDDFVPEGSATTGEVSLLVGAIATGAVQRLRDQLALGADPATSIASQGDNLARDRGTSESDGARWAVSVLAHAIGVIPADMVPTRPATFPSSLDRPDSIDPGPTQTIPDDATVPRPPDPIAPPPPPPPPTAAPPSAAARRGISPVLVGVVATLAIVAVSSIALLLLRDDDKDSPADDHPNSTSASGSEEVLGEITVTDGDKEVRVQLVHEGTEASLVLLADHDGSAEEVDRIPAGCPYLETAYDAGIQNQNGQDIYWGWQNTGTAGFGAYGQVQVADEVLVNFADPDAEPVCPGVE